MQVPSILQGESLSRLLQGAAAGAVASIVIGFSWGGWMTGSTANRLAAERADTAVAQANLAVIKKIPSSWEQGEYVQKGGWAHSRGLPPPTITWLGRVQRS